jgi:hypothetical protein
MLPGYIAAAAKAATIAQVQGSLLMGVYERGIWNPYPQKV